MLGKLRGEFQESKINELLKNFDKTKLLDSSELYETTLYKTALTEIKGLQKKFDVASPEASTIKKV